MTQEFVHDVSDAKDAYKLLMAYDGSGGFRDDDGADDKRWQGKEFEGEHGKYYQCSQYSTNGNCGTATAKGAGIGAAGGAVEGAAAGLASSTAAYTTATILGINDGWRWDEFGRSVGLGTLSGLLMGGAMSVLRYGMSSDFQWEAYEKVYDYGMARGREADVLQYIAKREGLDDIANLALTKEEYVISKDGSLGEGGSIYDEKSRKTNITIARSGRNTAANFYETVAHESYHAKFNTLSSDEKELMFKSLKGCRFADGNDAEEALVRDRLLSHKFSGDWGELRSIQIRQINGILNGPAHEQVKSTLDLYGKNHHLYY